MKVGSMMMEYFQFSFSQVFIQVHVLQIFKFSSPENENSEIDKNDSLGNSLLHHFDAFSITLPSFSFLSVIA